MKIRIKGNSLRLRLTQTEINTFAKKGIVTESIQFGLAPKDHLQYTLASFAGDAIETEYEIGKIVVKVPQQMAQIWTSSEQVGLAKNIPLGKDQVLAVLIEKDFQCMKPREGEDESDHFPNPEG